MSSSEQVHFTLNEDIDDTWVNDMVMTAFGIKMPPLISAADVIVSQECSHGTSIGHITSPDAQGSRNLNLNEQIHRQWCSPGTTRGDESTPEQTLLRVDRYPIPTVAPFFARNDPTEQTEVEPPVGLLLGENTGVDLKIPTSSSDDLRFSSLGAAMASIPTPDWLCPLNDPSIPTNDANRQTWVLHLVNAINNTTEVVDRRSAAFNKHWLSTPPFYHPAAIELLAWDILILTEDMHNTGPIVLSITDAKQSEHLRKTRDWTFARRMLSIIALLTKSKSRCEKCIHKVNVAMVVGNPVKLLKGSKGNQVQNGKRQELLQAGRELVKRRKLEQEAVDVGF